MGVVNMGGLDEIFLRYIMVYGGFKPTDIEVVRIGDPGAKIAAMKSGVVDGAINGPPKGTANRTAESGSDLDLRS